mgnify:FL=1
MTTIEIGDIVQADPDKTEWGPSLVIITEIRSWGIQGYTHIPRGGDAFIRLKFCDFEPTGGKAVWDRAPSEEEEAS